MALDLSSLPLQKLMKKFSAGGHKPGSGSAAALLGLISCALTKTVVEISKRHEKYRKAWSALERINLSIDNDIEPVLWQAFEQDSDQFDKVIYARLARDKEKSPHRRWKHARKASEELYKSIEIPLLIAEKCLVLAEYGINVYDDGFKSARGDSKVAIESALSAVNGAISIVYLNLDSFTGQEKAAKLLARAEEFEESARILSSLLKQRTKALRSKAKSANESFRIDIRLVRDQRKIDSNYSDSQIVEIARNLQNELWSNRNEIWQETKILNKIDILDPKDAFRVLGYRFDTPTTLGQINDGGETVEVAGYINKSERYAAVSKKFPLEVRRFTAAHELGHAVLHKANEQFRDRALDGSSASGKRSPLEREADKFAACFLMPESIMRELFGRIFGTDQFEMSDESAFALGATNATQLLNVCPTIRHLSLRLAAVDIFAGRPINSLADIFGVSYGAMAIRIEELKLIDLEGSRFAS